MQLPWLEITVALYVGGLTGVFVWGAVNALHKLRELSRKEGYEQGSRDTLEDELERKGKLIGKRKGLLGR